MCKPSIALAWKAMLAGFDKLDTYVRTDHVNKFSMVQQMMQKYSKVEFAWPMRDACGVRYSCVL